MGAPATGRLCSRRASVLQGQQRWGQFRRERDPGQLFRDFPQAALDGRTVGSPAGLGQFRVAPGPEESARAVYRAPTTPGSVAARSTGSAPIAAFWLINRA